MKIIVVCMFVLCNFFLFGQDTLFIENFDDSISSQWTIIDNDGFTVASKVSEYTEAWIYKKDTTQQGNGTASSTSFFEPAGRADRWLISPSISLGNSGNFISWSGMSFDPSFPDSYKVLLSTTGTDINDFNDTIALVTLETPYWSSYTIPIDEFANQQVHIAFVNFTYDGYKLFIDSICVRKNDPLSLANEQMNIQVAPNPFSNALHITTEGNLIQKVTVHTLVGKRIINKTLIFPKEEHTLNTTILSSGVYILSVQTNKGWIKRKIIK